LPAHRNANHVRIPIHCVGEGSVMIQAVHPFLNSDVAPVADTSRMFDDPRPMVLALPSRRLAVTRLPA
jgi:hypothetical protein